MLDIVFGTDTQNENAATGGASLSVHDHQREFLAGNSYSIAEASFNPALRTRAIFLAEEPIGFIMYSTPEPRDDTPGEYGIWRFMIDARYQGKGYGRQSLGLLLAEIGGCGDARRIYISYKPDNASAKHFYASVGFSETGIDDDGEMVAVLSPDRPPVVHLGNEV